MLRLAVLLIVLPAIALADITGRPVVVDGNSLKIGGERIRLHGIDAPESAQTCSRNRKVWQCGQQATQALREKIDGSKVRCEASERDRYVRHLGTCFLGGNNINAWMVRAGWAL